MSSSPYLLDKNVVWMAGAGTGKTHGLITLCLHLLGGARPGGTVHPSELCVLTFTDKAAAELRARLRQRLEALATGVSKDVEPELRGAFIEQNREVPPPSFWRSVLDEIGRALVGTFHVLAMRLIRSAPPKAGVVSQGFELLDELAARELIDDVAERVVLEALEREDPFVAELWRDLESNDFDGRLGLALQLSQIFVRLREHGTDPRRLEASALGPIQVAFEEKLSSLRAACLRARAMDAAKGHAFAPWLSAVEQTLEGVTFETFPEQHAELVAASRGQVFPTRGELAAALKELRAGILGHPTDKQIGLRNLYAAAQAVPLEVKFRDLLSELSSKHRQSLDRLESLDFSELLLRARDILRDDDAFRRGIQSKLKAVLVDEFQDTNLIQLELVSLLAGRRDGAGGLEPSMLCAVGDRKQSIYEFRGADVTVFEQLATMVESSGGGRRYLQNNRRSSPALLKFFNRAFAELMQPLQDPKDFEVVYVPSEDDLLPVREGAMTPCVERIVFSTDEKNAAQCREEEADLLAARIRQLLDQGTKPRDVAILLQRFTNIEVYRHALAEHDVPHQIVRGTGFYAAQEVLDLSSVLTLLADGSSSVALLATLRSPWVGLSDASLVRLGLAAGFPLQLASVTRHAYLLPEPDLGRLRRFLAWFAPFRDKRTQLDIQDVVSGAIEAAGYRSILAGLPEGEQAIANIEKLLALAETWDERAKGDLQSFADHLAALTAREPREAFAGASDLGLDAVWVMTVHQAKGLEWPIVALADLAGARGGGFPEAVAYDRGVGLALRPHFLDEWDRVETPRSQAVSAETKRRENAESMRKLYVALTRARDRVILSGDARPRQQASWRAKLEDICDHEELRPLVATFSEAELRAARAPPVAAATTANAAQEADEALRRVRQRPSPELQFSFVVSTETLAGSEPSRTTQMLRRALARLDFRMLSKAPSNLDSHIASVVRSLGVWPKSALNEELHQALRVLIASDLARYIGGLESDQVVRGAPYQVRAGSHVHVEGTLDLLYPDERGCGVVLHLIESGPPPSTPLGVNGKDVYLEAGLLAARGLVHADVPLLPAVFSPDNNFQPQLVPPEGIVGSLDRAIDLWMERSKPV